MPANKRDPLVRYLNAQHLTDAEIKRIMSAAATEAERVLARSGEGVGRAVRQAQLAVSRATQQAWSDVGDAVFVGIGDGVDAAAESMAYLNNFMFDQTGIGQHYWREAMLAQAREGIDSIRSRKINNIGLSDRVYKEGAVASGKIGELVNAGLVNNASARDIARSVKQYIDPMTPGGTSYAALRLGRSEVNNAFHTTSNRFYADQPWIEGVQWEISQSHPKPDLCDDYAGDVHFRGGEPGVFKPGEVPDKPHPQCFCYITPVTVSNDELIKRFNKGQYDSYVDQQVGCQRA